MAPDELQLGATIGCSRRLHAPPASSVGSGCISLPKEPPAPATANFFVPFCYIAAIFFFFFLFGRGNKSGFCLHVLGFDHQRQTFSKRDVGVGHTFLFPTGPVSCFLTYPASLRPVLCVPHPVLKGLNRPFTPFFSASSGL